MRLLLVVILLSLVFQGVIAKPKKAHKKPARSPVATKALDLMALAKDIASRAGDDSHFGEHYGTPVNANPQGRTYQPMDSRVTELMVLNQPGKSELQGVALVVNAKNPLTLRDVERAFGPGKEIKADAPGFTGLVYARVNGQYPVEPLAYLAVNPKDLKKTDPVFRLLLRRATP